jgi:hypothetical protein
MDRFARVILGYHGCEAGDSAEFAKRLLAGEAKFEDWRASSNDYDWLGRGIYFWEHGLERARDWAKADGLVLGAVIQLGNCLDLTDLRATRLLNRQFEEVDRFYRETGLPLPSNASRNSTLRRLDCLVINELVAALAAPVADDPKAEAVRIQTVRGAFEEGDEAFPGSMLRTQTHIQVAVRDAACILGVFLPNLM